MPGPLKALLRGLFPLVGGLTMGACSMGNDPMLTTPREGRALGGRVAVVYSQRYGIDLGGLERLHPFDIHKYDRIYEKLRDEELLTKEDVYVPGPLSDVQIRTVQSAAFLESLGDSRTVAGYLEAPVIGMLPAGTVERGVLTPFRIASEGTLVAARGALDHGVGLNLGGGYHHAKPDRGEGFCVFADIPIAIRLLQAEGRIRRALVIDLDAHQGNGTIVCHRGDPSVFTFSIHQGGIYPLPKEKGDLDVEIPAGTTDEDYLALLGRHLRDVLARSRADLVFVVAGCDTLAGDPLASIAMTPEGVARRDLLTVQACRERGLPVVVTLGGGYSSEAWRAQALSLSGIIRSQRGDPE